MLDELKLPKTLSKRLEKVAAIACVNPESILKSALKDKLDYLEWKEKAIAEGQSDLDNDRVVTTAQICESLAKQRAAKNKKAA
jgi:predicted transcriptional regulator